MFISIFIKLFKIYNYNYIIFKNDRKISIAQSVRSLLFHTFYLTFTFILIFYYFHFLSLGFSEHEAQAFTGSSADRFGDPLAKQNDTLPALSLVHLPCEGDAHSSASARASTERTDARPRHSAESASVQGARLQRSQCGEGVLCVLGLLAHHDHL